jgi:lipoyl(octanoyl) transferase
MTGQLEVRQLGVQPYVETWQNMKAFTESRCDETPDELWLLQHPPVFTQGQAGREEHLLAPGDIPVVQTDRGGQVTYHGPGQLVVYLLMDIRRQQLGIRDLVTGIEETVIEFLASHGTTGAADRGAPGVYVEGRKIAQLGLRIRKGRSYHGLSLNVEMDLEPFTRINPCGYEGLQVTDCRREGITMSVDTIAKEVTTILALKFGYDALPVTPQKKRLS